MLHTFSILQSRCCRCHFNLINLCSLACTFNDVFKRANTLILNAIINEYIVFHFLSPASHIHSSLPLYKSTSNEFLNSEHQCTFVSLHTSIWQLAGCNNSTNRTCEALSHFTQTHTHTHTYTHMHTRTRTHIVLIYTNKIIVKL